MFKRFIGCLMMVVAAITTADDGISVTNFLNEMNRDMATEQAGLNKKKNIRSAQIKAICESFSQLPYNFLKEFSKRHRIHASSITLVNVRLETYSMGEPACYVTTSSDRGICEHNLKISKRNPTYAEGLSNVECN